MTARIPLSPERIVEAAIAVADGGGLGAVSMRTVARELGVEAMSLYHHIAGREALLDALVERVFALIEVPEPGEPWRAASARRASSARSVLAAHPWALTLIWTRPAPGAALMHHHDRALGTLLEAGFSVPLGASVISMIDSYVYGFVLTEQSLPFSSETETTAFAESLDLPTDDYPYLARMMTELVHGHDYAYTDEFSIGLDLLLDAIELRFSTPAEA